MVHHDEEVMHQWYKVTIYTASSIKKQRAMNARARFTSSVCTGSQLEGCPQCVGPPSSINLITHRHTQKPISQVTLDPVKLTTLTITNKMVWLSDDENWVGLSWRM